MLITLVILYMFTTQYIICLNDMPVDTQFDVHCEVCFFQCCIQSFGVLVYGLVILCVFWCVDC